MNVIDDELLEYSIVNVNNIDATSFVYTKPFKYKLMNSLYQVKNWKELYVSICKKLDFIKPSFLQKLVSVSLGNTKTRIDFLRKSDIDNMISPKCIREGIYVETNLSAKDIIKKIYKLLDFYKIDDSDLIIYYINNKNKFYNWLRKIVNMADAKARSYTSVIKVLSEHGIKNKYLTKSIFEINEYETMQQLVLNLKSNNEYKEINIQQHNKFSDALEKYMYFLNADTNIEKLNNNKIDFSEETIEKYKYLLKNKFANGFRVESSLHIKKIKKEYLKHYGKEAIETYSEIESIIKEISISYNSRYYSLELMLDKTVRNKLFSYIMKVFENENKIIYYSALFSEFEKEFQTSNIYNPEMLKIYLKYYSKILEYEYYFRKSYFTNIENNEIDTIDEIRNFLKNIGSVVGYEKIHEKFSHIPLSKIKQIFAMNDEFIRESKGHYIHVSLINFDENDLENIRGIIRLGLSKFGFMSRNELIKQINNLYPEIIENNYFIKESNIALKDAIKYYLKNEFRFNGNIISNVDRNLSMSEVYSEYCKGQDEFTIDDLNKLKKELGSTIYFDSVYKNSVRINQEKFIKRDSINFNVKLIDEVIDTFCTDKYLPVLEIKQFSAFPSIDYPWNSFLLEHYVYSFSSKYKLLHIATFNANKIAGIIVNKNSKYNNFNDIIIDVIIKSNIMLTKDNILDYLYENGYIGRRNLSNVYKLINDIKTIKNRKG